MATHDTANVSNRITLGDVNTIDSDLEEMKLGSESEPIDSPEIVRGNPGNIVHPTTV